MRAVRVYIYHDGAHVTVLVESERDASFLRLINHLLSWHEI